MSPDAKPSPGKRILLTGPQGCGKTTVVRKVADMLGGGASGFYTEEVRDDTGQRIGFQVTSLDGKRGELARKDPRPGPLVGSYRVNVKAFEEIALPSMEAEAGRVLLIDEIGKMECCSGEFVRRVEQAFETDHAILATIPLRGGGDFIDKIRPIPSGYRTGSLSERIRIRSAAAVSWVAPSGRGSRRRSP